MAEKAGEEGGKPVERRLEGEKTENGELKEELEKKKRGRPRKEDKEEMKEAEGLKNFLKNGRIKKGRELTRTPIKKRATEEDKEEINECDGAEGGNSFGGDGMGAVVERGGELAEEKKTTGEEETESEASRIKASRCNEKEKKENEWEWMCEMKGRMNEIESKLERKMLCIVELQREVWELKAKNKSRENVMEARIVKLEKLVKGNSEKIRELQDRLDRYEINENNNEKSFESKGGSNNLIAFNKEKLVEERLGQSKGREIETEMEIEIDKEKQDDGKQNREYLRVIPEALGESEYEYEMKERERRRRNILIRGIRTIGKGRKEEIKEIIKKQIGIDLYIKTIRAIGGGLVLELYAMENKIEIMKRKGMLKGMDLWIEDDLTERERQIKHWLERLMEEEKINGLEVRIGYMKVEVDGIWYEWREKEGRLVEMNFRREGGQERY